MVFLVSCQMSRITTALYTPPKLVYPPDARSFIVTSRFVPATGPYEDVQWGAYESVDSLKWQLAESVIDTLGKRMIRDNLFLVKVRHKPRMLRHNDATLPDPLPWDGLAALAKKEYVQGILILEGFGIQEYPVDVKGSGANFVATQKIDVTLAIRACEPDKMRMLDDSVYVFPTVFSGEGKSADEASSQLPEMKRAMFEACSNAADSYFGLIRPGDRMEKRGYFSKGDTTLVKVSVYPGEGKWGKAESRWKWLAYNSPDTLVQAKASYNMALCCERDGRMNQAIGFARRSQRLHPDRRAKEYVELLEKKINEFDRLVAEGKIRKRW